MFYFIHLYSILNFTNKQIDFRVNQLFRKKEININSAILSIIYTILSYTETNSPWVFIWSLTSLSVFTNILLYLCPHYLKHFILFHHRFLFIIIIFILGGGYSTYINVFFFY